MVGGGERGERVWIGEREVEEKGGRGQLNEDIGQKLRCPKLPHGYMRANKSKSIWICITLWLHILI